LPEELVIEVMYPLAFSWYVKFVVDVYENGPLMDNVFDAGKFLLALPYTFDVKF